MPKVELSRSDLCKLIGKRLSLKEIGDAILYAKGEIDSVEGDLLKVDIKDTNRPDLWSAEGIAREIKGRLTKEVGCPRYTIARPKVVVKVDRKNKKVRPYTVCAVARNLKLTKDGLSQLIQLQEKVCGTFGRHRREVALGVYSLDRIRPPIRFTTVAPDGIKFVPLDFKKRLTPREILERHPKGREYGHLLAGLRQYPIFIDSAGEVLSIPPIINSDYSGKVTQRTRNVFIECSGFKFKFLVPALNVIVAALADRGAVIEGVKVEYPHRTLITPDLKPKSFSIEIDYVKGLSGLDLSAREICKLLQMARYDTKLTGRKIEVTYPAYRQDIMHQRDVVEDVLISYGYNEIEPTIPRLPTVGAADKREVFANRVAEIMVGLGFQEILSHSLTNKRNLFERMNLPEVGVVEIENVISAKWAVFRNWLLPGLLEFLSVNQHVEYPQRIFEIGDCVILDRKAETRTRDIRKLGCAIADTKVSYQEISSVLDALLSNLKVRYRLRGVSHPSFIPGRVAEILVKNSVIGIIGEVHPSVLVNFGLEMPVATFEIGLEYF
jgi:phenylalanyl-tRNA synthetase beta chain